MSWAGAGQSTCTQPRAGSTVPPTRASTVLCITTQTCYCTAMAYARMSALRWIGTANPLRAVMPRHLAYLAAFTRKAGPSRLHATQQSATKIGGEQVVTLVTNAHHV